MQANADRTDALDGGLLSAVAILRWVAWIWMAALAVLARDDLEVVWISPVLVGAAFALTAAVTVALRRAPMSVMRWPWLAAELAIGAALMVGDAIAYGPDPLGASAPPSLGSVWPISGVLAVAVSRGAVAGGLAGAAMAVANLAGKVVAPSSDLGSQALSIASTAVQFVIAGVALGLAAERIRRAEIAVTTAAAREEVARTLHDGVLQTLAVIQRRAEDPALERLAREQERELRDYLFGTGAQLGGGGDLGASLRDVAARIEDRNGIRTDIVVIDTDMAPTPAIVEALTGAVGECLTNAAKHGHADSATVYVEVGEDGSVFCSVKDAGGGFDPSVAEEGEGLTRSVRGRVAELGGRVTITAGPGRGAEVVFEIPAPGATAR